MNYTVKHKWVVPRSVVRNCVKAVNANKITIGVHKEDNDNHANRDDLGGEPAHYARYGLKSVGNAELLKKQEAEHNETVYVQNGEVREMVVPARPVLKPCVYELWKNNKKTLKNGVKKQFKFTSAETFKNYLSEFANKFNNDKYPLRFVMSKGEDYWEPNAKNNGIYTQIIKYLDYTRAYGAVFDEVFNEDGTFKTNVYEDVVGSLPNSFNTPLLDSMDMINSIKAKVEKR